MISGTRKPPPISTSSPRDTITSRSRASGAEREQHRGRVVVHDDAGLGAARASEQPAGVLVARPALARLHPVLEVRVAGGDVGCGRERAADPTAPARGSCARSRRWRSRPGAATTPRKRARRAPAASAITSSAATASPSAPRPRVPRRRRPGRSRRATAAGGRRARRRPGRRSGSARRGSPSISCAAA